MKTKRDITVLIIDEHSNVSSLLAERLSAIPGIRIIGETANVMLGAELAHQFEPTVILADFRRTGPPRAETFRWLNRVSPASRVVAHISSLAKGEEISLRDAGVDACYLKGLRVPELAERLFETSGKLNGRHASNGAREGPPAEKIS